MANIPGTPGRDRITGTVGDDFIEAFGGNDVIIGTQGFDFIDAGAGADIVNYGLINEAITLNPAGEINKGSAGTDTLRFVERIIAPLGQFNLINASLSSGGASVVVSLKRNRLRVRNVPGIGNIGITVNNFFDVIGTDQNDVIEGDDNSNILSGIGGNDFFRGSQGFDLINGGDGVDVVNYATINDAITLKPAGEIDKGIFGTDTLFQVERVIAPVGRQNTIDASTSSGSVSIVASLFRNRLSVRDIPGLGTRNLTVQNFADVTGTVNSDVLEGNSGNNALRGVGGNDTFLGTKGFDFLDGGDGFDTANYAALNQNLTLKATGVVEKGSFGTDSLFKVERIIAPTNRNNTIDASDSTTASIEANLENRFLNVSNVPGVGTINLDVNNFRNVVGSQVNDAVTGDRFNNSIDTQGGDDFITASRGNDFINGGDGFDIIDYTALNVAVTILPAGVVRKGAGASAGVDTAFRVDKFIGAAGKANLVNGSSASAGISFDISLTTQFFEVKNVPNIGSIIQFVENFVNVVGTNGSDFIEGTDGSNVLNALAGDDSIFGGGGNDRLTGGSGNDFIIGQDGNDRLNGTNSSARGQDEQDFLIGGNGSDRFTLGDASGSFYKATSFPSNDFDSFGFGGFLQLADISDLSADDRIELGRGETYRVERTNDGFDLYVVNSGRFDAISGVTTTSFISNLPVGTFSLAAGQTQGIFIGV